MLPLAAIARAAAHVTRAPEHPERNHLGLALKELIDAAALDASITAENTGMSWTTAMASTDGPGWAARRARNAELAGLVRTRLPAGSLGRTR